MTVPDAARPTGLTRRTLIQRGAALGATGALMPWLIACGGSSSSGTDTLRVGTTERLDSLNPFVSSQNVTWSIMAAIFPMLTLQESPGAEPQPGLAKSWTLSEDGLRYELKLRTGGRWTDGKPLTARDVAFTLNMMVEHAGGAAAGTSGFVVGVKRASAPDDATVVVEMSAPTPAFLSNMACPPMLPEHVWKPLAQGKAKGLATYQVDADAVTCGPFRLAALRPDGVTMLERYDGTYGDRPPLARVGFAYQASDAAMLNAFKGNAIDTLDWSGNYIVGVEDLGGDFTTDYGPSGNLWYLGFNMSPTKTGNRELQDKRVRAALAHATDRPRIVEAVLFDKADQGAAFVPPAAGDWHDGSLEPEEFDPERAGAMLEALGYRKGADGIRIADGHPMSYTFPCAKSVAPSVGRVAEIIADGWRAAGVELEPRLLDTPAMVDATLTPEGYKTNDVYLWYQSMLTDPQFLLSTLTSSQVGAYNDTGFVDPRYERLYREQARQLDRAKRVELVNEMQGIVYDEKPLLPLVYPSPFVVTQQKFEPLAVSSGLGAFPAWANGWPYAARAAT
jgi:peptide/nickel transport system substrate-binding protein